MDKINILKLLKKLTDGELTEQERVELAKYIHEPKNNPVIYEFMDSFWEGQHKNPASFESIKAEKVFQKIKYDPRFTSQKVKSIFLRKLSRFRVAASFLIVSFLAIPGYRIYQHRFKQPLVFTEYRSGIGKMVKKKLPDGSSVWLNANSSIKFAENFNEDTRDLFLSGEAYFDVAHDESKPFIVHTGTVVTKVLGTAFDINSYDQNKLSITVSRGKVSVADGNTKLALLTRHKQLNYDVKTKNIEKLTVNSTLATSWTTGELVFDNVTLIEASKIISNWYNVKFVFNDPKIEDTKFVISFKNTAEITQVLDILGKLNHFTYTLKNNQVNIDRVK